MQNLIYNFIFIIFNLIIYLLSSMSTIASRMPTWLIRRFATGRLASWYASASLAPFLIRRPVAGSWYACRAAISLSVAQSSTAPASGRGLWRVLSPFWSSYRAAWRFFLFGIGNEDPGDGLV